MLFFARVLSRPVVALAVVLIPTMAGAASAHRKQSPTARVVAAETKRRGAEGSAEKGDRVAASRGALPARSKGKGLPRGCFSEPVEVISGSESAIFSLTNCAGSATPLAVDQLSVLARPPSVSRPKESLDILAKATGVEPAPGVRRFDPRIVERLAQVVEHFHAEGDTPRVTLVSGYRRRGTGSYHSKGRAVDFRLAGVTDEALLAFCKTLQDTGCGYYPNSDFVHMDVRAAGAGHVAWVDVSRPGEPPRYAARWPAAESPEPMKLPVLPASDARNTAASPIEQKDSKDGTPHSI